MRNDKPSTRFLAAILSMTLAIGGVPAPALAEMTEIEAAEDAVALEEAHDNSAEEEENDLERSDDELNDQLIVDDATTEDEVITETTEQETTEQETTEQETTEQNEPAGADDSDNAVELLDPSSALVIDDEGIEIKGSEEGRPAVYEADEEGLVLYTQSTEEPAQGTTATKSGLVGVSNPGMEELRSLYFSLPSVTLANLWSTPADLNAYTPSTLSGTALDYAEDFINLHRRAANLGSIALDDGLNASAAQGALILARLNEFTHYPSTPNGVSDAQAEPGKDACATSNLSYAWGVANPLQSTVSGQMADSDSSNMDVLGHRRWLLRPEASAFGIGAAQANDSSVYSCVRVFGSTSLDDGVRTNGSTDYDFIAWPPSGDCLNNLFSVGTPWSVTLNPSRYQAPALGSVQVVITRTSDGASWTLNSADTAISSGEYFNVNTDGYGVANCIVFNPGADTLSAMGTKKYRGEYKVRVTGIKTTSGQSATLSYAVNFDSALKDLSDGKGKIAGIANQVYAFDYSRPVPSVTYNGKALVKGTDFTLSYSNNWKPGTATVIVEGCGKYEGQLSKTFTIVKAPSTISLAAQTKPYTGSALSYSGNTIRTGSTGAVTYRYYRDAACTKEVVKANVKNAGTYYVKATLAADDYYAGKTSAAVKFTITKAASKISIAAQKKTYTGKKLAYTGKVTRSGSAGKITYKYYSDAKCTKAVKPENVKAVKTYYVRATLAADASHKSATSAAVKFTVAKAANPLVVKAAAKTVKRAVVKKKAQTVAPVTATKAQGKKSFSVAKWTTAKAKKYFTVSKTTGKVTAKRGTPKGTYKFKVKVSAKGNANYKAGSKTVAVKVVVK